MYQIFHQKKQIHSQNTFISAEISSPIDGHFHKYSMKILTKSLHIRSDLKFRCKSTQSPKRAHFFEKSVKFAVILTPNPNYADLTLIFINFLHKMFENNRISAEIMRFRGISRFWRKRALFFKKWLISADDLIFSWKSGLSTKSQRKRDYFRQKNVKIVCHDPQIRSIFLIFQIRFNFSWKPTSESWGSKYEAKIPNTRWMCSHISVISLCFCSELARAIIIN